MNADYVSRGIISTTPKLGLTIVGPNCLDSQSVLGQVHNAAMLTLEEKLTALEAKITALQALLSVKEETGTE
jgi:hypothetical protein